MGNPVEFAGNASDLHLGPASVTYNGKNLGYTLNDSVSIQIEQESTEILPDQSSLPVKDIITGMTLNVTMTLARSRLPILIFCPVSAGVLSVILWALICSRRQRN